MKKVQSGESLQISAETFNTFIDAAVDLKSRRLGVAQQSGPFFKQSGIVPLQNGTGEDRSRFDLVGIHAPIIEPQENLQEFQNRPAFLGVTPDDHAGQFAVLQEPCKAGRIVPAVVSGVTVARVNVIDDSHEMAEVEDDEHYRLLSNVTGSAAILCKQPGTGLKWAIVRLSNSVPRPWQLLYVIGSHLVTDAWDVIPFNATSDSRNPIGFIVFGVWTCNSAGDVECVVRLFGEYYQTVYVQIERRTDGGLWDTAGVNGGGTLSTFEESGELNGSIIVPIKELAVGDQLRVRAKCRWQGSEVNLLTGLGPRTCTWSVKRP